MSTIERHPLPTYYTLTFSISWGGMLLVIGGPSGLPGSPAQADRLMGIAFSVAEADSAAVTLAMERLAAILPRCETKEFPRLDYFGIERTAPREVAQAVHDDS